jgi:hypothetical protein
MRASFAPCQNILPIVRLECGEPIKLLSRVRRRYQCKNVMLTILTNHSVVCLLKAIMLLIDFWHMTRLGVALSQLFPTTYSILFLGS